MSGTPCAVVYAWEDAPEELRALSREGGDEDWVVLLTNLAHGIPLDVDDEEYLPAWGCADRHEIQGTDLSVIIFAHA